MNNSSIRIGVLGDLGVGKAELVHRLCHPDSAGPAPTASLAGPTVDVLDYARRDGRGHVWVEFIVIPGETRHPRSRQMVYSIGLDALFLVCNGAAHRTLLRAAEWMEEAAGVGQLRGAPVALVLGGPVSADWAASTALTQAIEPLVATYRAQVLDLSGYTSGQVPDPRQRVHMHDFFELVLRHKESMEQGASASMR
ncbi:Rab-like protein 3 [Coemansia biformis]|uniref:Rab-like protein 3 n=1 Tax=Coemansia biformis TaxID=1286918 RepID=A0A9W7YCN0_9FUNG|nr:Rab-like protein 3 [Coemansia biformis]